MARPLRLERPGAVYHVSTLGNAGLPVFRIPDDSRQFLEILGEVCSRFRWRCLTFCLLPDRYLLVVKTEAASLSRGMRQLNGRYTQAFHRRHGTAGHLFQGRYRAVMVEEAGYLAPVCCDVLRQPVVQEIAPEAGAWRWSSYRAALGRPPPVSVEDWLDNGPLLAAFDSDRATARTRLSEALAREPATAVWDDLRHQVFLGSEAFVQEMREAARRAAAGRGDLAEIPRAQWRAPPPALESFAAAAGSRDEAMARAYLSGAYSQAAIAAYYGVHYSSVSRAIRRYERSQPASQGQGGAG